MLAATACSDGLERRPYDEVAYATTHNAMSSADDEWLVPSQEHDVPTQLADGVRGLMLDIHEQEGEAWLCHGYCSLGSQRLEDGLAEILVFMEDDPDAVVTLILENYVSAELLERAFDDSGLLALTTEHDPLDPWPTLRQMVRAGERVVVLTDDEGDERPWLLHIWSHAWETPWNAEVPDDLDCSPSRGETDNALLILNHFLTDPVALPSLAAQVNANPFFEDRALGCMEQTGQLPNFVTVDFYATGALFEVVEALNQP